MASERSQTNTVLGDSLDSFVSSLAQSLSDQQKARNLADETRFNTAVLEDNLSLDDQLAFRKQQLKDVSDDPTERARIRGEISSLTNQIEQKKFSDAYLSKLTQYQSGLSSIDSVISWLTDQKATATDPTIQSTIDQQLSQQQQTKFEMTKQLLNDQTNYALNDKSDSVLSTQITKVSAAKAKAILAGDDNAAASYDLQLQALNKAKTENSISNDVKNFAVTSITGYSSATGLLNQYNSKISSADSTTPVTIGGTTYASATEFWTYKRDSYLADSSAGGFFGQLNQEVNAKIKTMSSNNTLDTASLQAALKPYDQLTSRPELKGYDAQIQTYRQDSVQTGTDLVAGSIADKYSTNYDLNSAVNNLNVLASVGGNTSQAYTKILTAGAQIKDQQVSGILSAAQAAMKNDPTLTPDKAINMAISTGAGAVQSPEDLAKNSETDITKGFADKAAAGSFANDPRTTVANPPAPAATTPAAGSSTAPASGSIVDYLNSKGQDSSYTARAKLAAAAGIQNYTGTAAQNTQLLQHVSNTPAPVTTTAPAPVVNTSLSTPAPVKTATPAPAAPKPSTATNPAPTPLKQTTTPATTTTPQPVTTTTAPKSSYQGSSIVDYLGTVGQDSSFTNRTKLAAAHGITNYQGTADQNTQLLKTLRGF